MQVGSTPQQMAPNSLMPLRAHQLLNATQGPWGNHIFSCLTCCHVQMRISAPTLQNLMEDLAFASFPLHGSTFFLSFRFQPREPCRKLLQTHQTWARCHLSILHLP